MAGEKDQERIDLINQLANGLGGSLLEICRGDWDLALSVATTLFASCVAQAAIHHEEDVEALFNECGEPAYRATMAFHAEFIKPLEEDGE